MNNIYFEAIINDINNNKSVIDLSNSNLTDENIIYISDLIKDNILIEKLIIANYNDRNCYNNVYKYNISHIENDDDLCQQLKQQYNNNIINKITIEGYNYLFETLKYNNTIHTLIIQFDDFNDEFYNNLSINNFVDKLSEMLLINKSIINLEFYVKINNISKLSFIKFFNAIKNHSEFNILKIPSCCDDDEMCDILIDSLSNQKYITNLNLGEADNYLFSYIKFIDIIDNLEYLETFEINPRIFYNPLFNNIIQSLENKNYLKKIFIYYIYDKNYHPLLNLLNKNIEKIEIYTSSYDTPMLLNDNLKQVFINNTKLKTLRLHHFNISINDIIEIIQKNSSICNLDLSNSKIKPNLKSLFDELKCNTNITKLNINNISIKDTSELLSLNELILNNKNIIKLNINHSINFNNDESLQILDSLTCNNTINKLWVYPDYSSTTNIEIINHFIDKICILIKNNKNIYKLVLLNELQSLMEICCLCKKVNNINLLYNEYYNKIYNSLQYNKCLIDIKFFDLFLFCNKQ